MITKTKIIGAILVVISIAVIIYAIVVELNYQRLRNQVVTNSFGATLTALNRAVNDLQSTDWQKSSVDVSYASGSLFGTYLSLGPLEPEAWALALKFQAIASDFSNPDSVSQEELQSDTIFVQRMASSLNKCFVTPNHKLDRRQLQQTLSELVGTGTKS